MRIILFNIALILALLLQPSENIAQNLNGWELHGSQTFQSAQYLTDQKMIVVGGGGQIRLSNDGGATWHANNQSSHIGFQSVSFIDSLHGLIAALTGEIYHSSDGGLTWIQQTKLKTYRLSKILMVSADTAYVCGSAGAVFRSSDGGKTWDSLSSGEPFFIRNLYFQNSKTGYAIGDSGMILKTINAGNSWTIQPTDSNFKLLGINFLDSLHGAVCGQSGYAYITSDGGKKWLRNLIDFTTQQTLVSINWHSLSSLTAFGVGGGLFISKSGGVAWDPLHLPNGLHYPTILFNGGFNINGDRGWAVGFSGIILTSLDSGNSWQQSASYPMSNTTITDMHFFDTANGYAVGGNNMVLKTDNGGDTWKSLTGYSSDLQIKKLFAPTEDTAFVLGSYGWLEKTTDAWKTWYQDSPPEVPGLQFSRLINPNDLYMLNRSLGYLVGDTIIWKTIDGCNSWSASIWHSNWIANGIERVFFSSEQTGYSLGTYSVPLKDTGYHIQDFGILFRTRNGGATWDTLNYGYRNRMHGLYFWSDEDGIIICDSGIVLKTSDGGDSWRESFRIPDMVPGQSQLSGINFITRKVGYISSIPAKIFLTTDGGETWSLDLDLHITQIQDFAWVTRIIFPDTNTVVVCAYQGFLRKHFDLAKLEVKDLPSETVNNNYLWLKVIENPASTVFSCKVYGWLDGGATLKIYDILGRPVEDMTRQLLRASNTSFTTELKADISSISNGLYMVVITDKGYIHSEKFMVLK